MTISVQCLLKYGCVQMKAMDDLFFDNFPTPVIKIGMTKDDVMSTLLNCGDIYSYPPLLEWLSQDVFIKTKKLDAHERLLVHSAITELRDQHKVAYLEHLAV